MNVLKARRGRRRSHLCEAFSGLNCSGPTLSVVNSHAHKSDSTTQHPVSTSWEVADIQCDNSHHTCHIAGSAMTHHTCYITGSRGSIHGGGTRRKHPGGPDPSSSLPQNCPLAMKLFWWCGALADPSQAPL